MAQAVEARWRLPESLGAIGYGVMKVMLVHQKDSGSRFS
jgi:hypothetical protein